MPEIFLLTGLARALTLLTPFRGLWVRSSRTSTTTEDPRVAALPRGLARVLALLVLVCCPACGSDGADPFDPGPDPNPETDLPIPPVTSGTWYRPPVTTTWQWQLQGDLNTEYEVALYELDLFETPASVISALKASGHRLLCYFSAGSWEDFRPDAGQFPLLDSRFGVLGLRGRALVGRAFPGSHDGYEGPPGPRGRARL